jgi:hypothetical protein
MATLTQFPSGLKFGMAIASLPWMSLYAAPAPEVLSLVQDILEEFYTDGIDQIVSAALNDAGDIEGEFIDQVGARQVKRYRYLIQDDNVAFKLLNPNEVEQFSGLEQFSGKKKTCKKGTPCGLGCISAAKTCKKTPSAESKEKIKAAKAGLGQKTKPSGGGTVSKPPTTANPSTTAPKGGALVLSRSARAEEKKTKARFPGDRRQEIDEKYAAENPKARDVEKWKKERLKNDFVNSPENARRIAREAITQDLIGHDPHSIRYAKDITDADSYARAALSIEKASDTRSTVKIGDKTYDKTDLEFWQYQLDASTNTFNREAVEKAKKAIASTKTLDKTKVKAQKVLDDHAKQLESNKFYAKKTHDMVMARRNTPEADRLNYHVGQYNDQMKSQLPKAERFLDDFKKGAGNFEAEKKLSQSVEPDSNKRIGKGDRVFEDYLTNKALGAVHQKYLGGAETRADLKKAFKSFAQKNHPDAGGSKELFQKVNLKYQELLPEMP